MIDPALCPLCGNNNRCLNLSKNDEARSCWCDDPKITFTNDLLEKTEESAKGKSCICEACVLKSMEGAEVSIYEP